MVPQVFLSLSGRDDEFVTEVSKHLPEGLAMFYRRSFENGRLLLEQMEQAVGRSSVFVFFASRASLQSPWVRFEVDAARVRSIVSPNLRLLVFPLATDVQPNELPSWIQQYWVPNAGLNPKDVARYIRHVITTPPIAPAALSVPVMGRGGFLDSADQRFMDVVGRTGRAPNALIFSGVSGIGRRTVARHFLKHAFPALPDLVAGPELRLPQFADIADIYRGIRELIDAPRSMEAVEADIRHFRSLNVQDQVREVLFSLQHFGTLHQAVIISTGSGLFEDRGDLKKWVVPMIDQLEAHPDILVVLVSNRQFREELLQSHPNALHLHVPPLRDADLRALMTATSQAFSIPPVSVPENVVRAIGGHPEVGKAAVRLIYQRGPSVLKADPSSLYSIQDQILSENLDMNALSAAEKDLLCILSWVPRLNGQIAEEVLKERHGTDSAGFASVVENLILGCLMTPVENAFAISTAIRAMFRRKYGYGPEGLLQSFSKALHNRWSSSERAGEFDADLFDAFVFMHALEGRSLPKELRALLLPSTLQQLIQEAYARGKEEDDDGAMRKVVEWGQIADKVDMDDAAREEILSTVAKAHVRLGQYVEAEKVAAYCESRGYRYTSFLRGFSLRRQNKYKEAVKYFSDAVETGKGYRSAVQELATCYQKLGMNKELQKLIEEHASALEMSASLLSFHIGILISRGNVDQAEAGIQRLAAMPDDDGRSTVRRAQLLMMKQDFRQAERLLSALLARGVGAPVEARRFRAIAAARAGNFELARSDIEFVQSRPGRGQTAQRLLVHYELARRNFKKAEELLTALGTRSVHDDALRARILEEWAADAGTPLAERERYRQEAVVLRARARDASAFDVE